MRPPLADVVVLVPALDLPARVSGVGLQVETGAVQPAALRNVIPVSRVSLVSLTSQIFGTGHSKDWSRPVKTDRKPVNWKWSLISWSGFWDRSQFWDWLTS